jgi:hypothetical protein
MYHTTTKAIIKAKRFFEQNPEGELNTGIWTQPYWTKDDFYKWFRKCLNLKTGGSEYTDRQWQKIKDARIINDRYQKNLVRSGTNILNDPKYKRLYPQIDNYSITDF